MKFLKEILRKIGLSEGEISACLFLLTHGPATVNKISKYTGLNRSNLYTILNRLSDKKLVQAQKSKRTTYYLPAPTSSFIRLINGRVKELKQLRFELESSLRTLMKSSKHTPIANVEILSGKETIKEILLNIVHSKERTPILCFGYEYVFEKFYPNFFDRIKLMRKKRSLPFFGLLFCTRAKRHKEKPPTWIKYIKRKKVPRIKRTQIVLFKDIIYLFLLSNLPIVIKIQSEQLYEFLKFLFWTVWDLL